MERIDAANDSQETLGFPENLDVNDAVQSELVGGVAEEIQADFPGTAENQAEYDRIMAHLRQNTSTLETLTVHISLTSSPHPIEDYQLCHVCLSSCAKRACSDSMSYNAGCTPGSRGYGFYQTRDCCNWRTGILPDGVALTCLLNFLPPLIP